MKERVLPGLLAFAALALPGCTDRGSEPEDLPLAVLVDPTEPLFDHELLGSPDAWRQEVMSDVFTYGLDLAIGDARRAHVERDLASMAYAFRQVLLEGLSTLSDVRVIRLDRSSTSSSSSAMELGRGLVARSNPRGLLAEVGASLLVASNLTTEGDDYQITVSFQDARGNAFSTVSSPFGYADFPGAIASVLTEVAEYLGRSDETASVLDFVETLPVTTGSTLWLAGAGGLTPPTRSFRFRSRRTVMTELWMLDEALRQDSASSAVLSARARAFTGMADDRDALRAAAEVYRLAPSSAFNRAVLAEALVSESLVVEAATAYGRALLAGPNRQGLADQATRLMGPIGCFDLSVVLGRKTEGTSLRRGASFFAQRALATEAETESWEGFRRSEWRYGHSDSYLGTGLEPSLSMLEHGREQNDAMIGLWNRSYTGSEHQNAVRILRETIAHVDSLHHGSSLNSWILASWAGLIGEQAMALDYLERAYDEGFRWIAYLQLNPFLEGIRETERYRELEARIESDLVEMRARYEALPDYVTDRQLRTLIEECDPISSPRSLERLEAVVDSVLAEPRR